MEINTAKGLLEIVQLETENNICSLSNSIFLYRNIRRNCHKLLSNLGIHFEICKIYPVKLIRILFHSLCSTQSL